MGSASLSPVRLTDAGSHLGLKKIQYITKRRKKKRPENLKWWHPDQNLECQEYH